MARRLLPSAAALCVPLLAANPSAALEPLRIGERPVLVEVTEATSVIYNADNRDTRSGDVPSVANDQAGFVYNRLNLSASSEPFRVSLRLDGAWFFASPSPDSIADELVSRSGFEGDARDELYAQKATEAGIELSNRYINWLYPAKYTLSYSARDFELALGDTTVQLGRGLVLSVRKRSEEHTSELQSQSNLVCRLLLEKKKKKQHKQLQTKQRGPARTSVQTIPLSAYRNPRRAFNARTHRRLTTHH